MVTYNLPKWLVPDLSLELPDLESQVQYAIDLSAQNVKHNTGGPFGAAVFCDGLLLGAGVNRVMPENCSMLHAEVMAIMEAQHNVGNWDLTGARLVTSCQPCCMCFGAVLWSGVAEMVYAATAADASAIGFDEGPLVEDWEYQLTSRGIQVTGPILRNEASLVLVDYEKQGVIYNPGGAPEGGT